MKEIAPIMECFGIDVSIQDSMPLISPGKDSILRLSPSSRFTLDNPIRIDADPFLFVYNDTLFLFYEDLKYYCKGGNIYMTKTKDLKYWSKPIPILDQDHVHFSFPFIYEENGEVYMIPETGCVDAVNLYKATDDTLEHFIFDSCLLKDEKRPADVVYNYADTVVYKKENHYYLFTSIYDGTAYTLKLYYSSNLRGPYSLHPSSPLQYSNKYGRNGGSIIDFDGHLYRVAQDCSKTYGGDIHLLEIDKLTPLLYKEHVYKENLNPPTESLYKEGGHQLSFAKFKGKTVIATDYKSSRRFYLLKGWHKILRGLKLSEY